MKIKICGMRDYRNIIDVSKLNPDYMGFIFYEKSKRFFNGDIPNICSKIEKIGVFVNERTDKIIEILNKHEINTVQLHGDENIEFCKELKKRNFTIIKAFNISKKFDFKYINKFNKYCDYYLFDTKGNYPGGNGFKFNWQILKNYNEVIPYFLSGGIGIEDANEIIEFSKTKAGRFCVAIDINSKCEVESGVKDINIIKNLINNLR
tara:strand:+ start:928 stop:1545 length:618 start_codon:yes stop_codon:yes gene_type:complete